MDGSLTYIYPQAPHPTALSILTHFTYLHTCIDVHTRTYASTKVG